MNEVEALLQKEYEEKIEKERQLSLEQYKNVFSDYANTPQVQHIIEQFKYFRDIHTRFDIYTTRFDSNTYAQNMRFKSRILWGSSVQKNNESVSMGSLYSTTTSLPVSASKDKFLFILDMNNTTNKIMGVGFIKNIKATDQSLQIYDNPCFNHYIYKSQFYVSLVDNPLVEQNKMIQDFIFTEFENVLFYGRSHMKRGGGYTCFPRKWLKFTHLRFLLTLFAIENPNQFNKIVLSIP